VEEVPGQDPQSGLAIVALAHLHAAMPVLALRGIIAGRPLLGLIRRLLA
jgi:hypothetical protein